MATNRASRTCGLRFLVCLVLSGCYAGGGGEAPPPHTLVFPTGVAVSPGGRVLYVLNSNFDLRYNSGTVQSYDLGLLRQHVEKAIKDPNDSSLPRIAVTPELSPVLLLDPATVSVNPGSYIRDEVHLGALGMDLVLEPQGKRLYALTRGDNAITYFDLPPPGNAQEFQLPCGTTQDKSRINRCSAAYQLGAAPPATSRENPGGLPGEPFGLTLSADGRFLVVTHHVHKISLVSTGFSPGKPLAPPTLLSVLSNVPKGGNGLAEIPYNPEAWTSQGLSPPSPAFLLTSQRHSKLARLRLVSNGNQGSGTPVLVESKQNEKDDERNNEKDDEKDNEQNEKDDEHKARIPLHILYNTEASRDGSQGARSLVIDRTPALRCKAQATPGDAQELLRCAQQPARLFLAYRNPNSLLLGSVGKAYPDGSFDPDAITFTGSVPLLAGPSRLYLGPVVDHEGKYALRVFVLCFEAGAVMVYNPDSQRIEQVITVGGGPHAMAFDPFSLEEVASNKPARESLRLGYVANFSSSVLQVLPLDNRPPYSLRFGKVVLTVGATTAPFQR